MARSLTAEAAEAAGLGNVTLLEEPQAAFYAWTARAGRQWRDAVAPGDVILVCDVGGGTADFSLIAVTDVAGNLELERISVGEHILLGGDNMDLALAYTLQARLEAEGKVAGCLAVPGAGACRIAGEDHLVRGHQPWRKHRSRFRRAAPACLPKQLPRRSIAPRSRRSSSTGSSPRPRSTILPHEARRTGLQEFGLPYASDPVISKHLARFLTRSLQNVKASDKLDALVGARAGGQALMPTAVLFNGGVFKAEPIRARVLDLLASWNGGQAVRELEGFEPDLAVAQGAAIYGRHRATGKGMRIKAGTSRSYYIGLEASMPAIPGFRPPVKALCVVPQGMQEGTELLIEGRTFGLVTGQAAEFRFFSSAVRSGDTPGQLLPDAERELEETSLLEVELPALPDVPAGQVVPVRIESVVTELGTLELWMKHTNSDRRWKIEFQVRTE